MAVAVAVAMMQLPLEELAVMEAVEKAKCQVLLLALQIRAVAVEAETVLVEQVMLEDQAL